MLDNSLNNPVLLEKVSRSQREESLQLALRTQRPYETRVSGYILLDRLRMRVGGLLITLGQKMQARCLLVMPQESHPHPSKY